MGGMCNPPARNTGARCWARVRRIKSAEAWLNSNKEKAVAEERSQFKSFLASQGSNPERSPQAAAPADRLFDEYLKWIRARGQPPSGAVNIR
jgi:hypothetical protein